MVNSYEKPLKRSSQSIASRFTSSEVTLNVMFNLTFGDFQIRILVNAACLLDIENWLKKELERSI